DECYFPGSEIDKIELDRLTRSRFQCNLCGNKIDLFLTIIQKIYYEVKFNMKMPLICCSCYESLQKKKFERIIDNIKEAYFEVDMEGKFTFMNNSFTQMTGYSSNELMSKDYAQLMDDMNKKKVFEIFNSVYNSGLPQENFQFEFINKTNTKVMVETSVYLNNDISGKKIGFYGISKDITQRFNLENKLKQSEEKYRHLFENSPYAIWIMDLNGIVIDCNSSTDMIIPKHKRKDLIGKNFVEILGLLDRPEYYIPFLKSKFKSFLRDEPMKPLELRMNNSEGSETWM
ncbi:unnamed protein product, partial [marine sediment metagenome]